MLWFYKEKKLWISFLLIILYGVIDHVVDLGISTFSVVDLYFFNDLVEDNGFR